MMAGELKIIFLFCTLLTFVSICLTAKCSKNRKLEADRCAKAGIIFSDDEIKIPKTIADMDEYCRNFDKNGKCIQKYGKDCLKGFAAQALRVGYIGFKRTYRKICNKTSEKLNFLKNISWMTDDNRDVLNQCLIKSVACVEYINNQVKYEEQIPQACCSYWLSRQCLTSALNKVAPDKSIVDYFENQINTGIANLANFLCSKQDSLETCYAIMPDAMRRMAALFNSNTKSETKLKSLLLPFLEVIADI